MIESQVGEVYDKYKGDDGFMRISLTEYATFGWNYWFVSKYFHDYYVYKTKQYCTQDVMYLQYVVVVAWSMQCSVLLIQSIWLKWDWTPHKFTRMRRLLILGHSIWEWDRIINHMIVGHVTLCLRVIVQDISDSLIWRHPFII